MSNEIFSSLGKVVATNRSQVEMSSGQMVIGQGDLMRAARGYAATTTRGTIPAHTGVVVKAEPNSLQHAFGVVSLRRADNHVLKDLGVVVMQTFFPPWTALDLNYEFLDYRFPDKIGYGSSGGPGFKTSVFRMDSGQEVTKIEWDRIRARYIVEYEYATGKDVQEVEEFFYGMRGQAIGFRFKDWGDYQITNQVIGVGDGTQTQFQLFKRYSSGGYHFDRIIKKPVRGTVGRILKDDVELFEVYDYGINYSTGLITFDTPPESGTVLTITYIEYDVPVRFDTDELMVEVSEHDQYAISNLSMIEIRV